MDKKIALLIGNSEYRHHGSLQGGPERNVAALEKKLHALGFAVKAETDCTLAQMIDLQDEFLSRLRYCDVGWFYFSGHGLEHKGVTYLCPTDAPAKLSVPAGLDEGHWLRDHFFSFNQRHEAWASRYLTEKVSIAVLDCCRSDPLAPARAEVGVPHGAFYSFATSAGQYAFGNAHACSAYTKKLLKWIDAPGLTLEEMFRRVREDVEREAINYHGRIYTQVAWDHSSLVGDFKLNPNGVLVPPPDTGAPDVPAEDAPAETSGEEKMIDALCPYCGAQLEDAGGGIARCPFCRRTSVVREQ